jgi:osmotically-inducible protein OsmY
MGGVIIRSLPVPCLRFPALIFAGLALAAPLSGCIVAVAGGAAAGTYAIVASDLPAKQQLRDVAIKAVVIQSWGDFNQELAHRLDATVFDGQVLITGRVPNQQWRDEAVKRAWRVDGVKQVYDETAIGPDTHFIDEARDAWIATQLRGELIGDVDIKSINYTIKTEEGVVYLMGVARTKPELDRAIDHARNIPQAIRVVNLAHLLPAAPANADANPPPATNEQLPPPPPERSPPSSSGTIKVEPLP